MDWLHHKDRAWFIPERQAEVEWSPHPKQYTKVPPQSLCPLTDFLHLFRAYLESELIQFGPVFPETLPIERPWSRCGLISIVTPTFWRSQAWINEKWIKWISVQLSHCQRNLEGLKHPHPGQDHSSSHYTLPAAGEREGTSPTPAVTIKYCMSLGPWVALGMGYSKVSLPNCHSGMQLPLLWTQMTFLIHKALGSRITLFWKLPLPQPDVPSSSLMPHIFS